MFLCSTFDTLVLESVSGSEFSAEFPIPAQDLSVGDSVFYKLKVSDNSVNMNSTNVPETGWYSFEII